MKKFCTIVMIAFFGVASVMAQPPDPTPAPAKKAAGEKKEEAKPQNPPLKSTPKAEKPKEDKKAAQPDRKPWVRYPTWVNKVFEVKIGDTVRKAYWLANHVLPGKDHQVPGFYWEVFGGNPFIKINDMTFDEMIANLKFWKTAIVPKVLSAVGVASVIGIEMPSDGQLQRVLENPDDPAWHDDTIHNGDMYAFGVGGSPPENTVGLDEPVEHPGHGPTDDYTVYTNITVHNPGHRGAARKATLAWDDEKDPNIYHERDVVVAKSCINHPLFTHIRTMRKKEVKKDMPALPPNEVKGPPDDGPDGEDQVGEPAPPPKEFDRINRGKDIGVHLVNSASTGAKLNGRGDLLMDSLKWIRGGIRLDGYYVMQRSDVPTKETDYWRFYWGVGGKYFANVGESSDEEAGAGAALDLEVKAEYVKLIGDNRDLAGGLDLNGGVGSTATRRGIQAFIETHPRTGRGLGGSLSYTDASTDIKEGLTVDGRAIEARVSYQILKDGEFTPLPGGQHFSPYIRLSDQLYTSSEWESHQRGPGLGFQWLHSYNRWVGCGDGEDCQRTLFVFTEWNVEQVHVTGKDALGNVTVDDTTNQINGFLGVRFGF
jgi:hypothetical protein